VITPLPQRKKEAEDSRLQTEKPDLLEKFEHQNTRQPGSKLNTVYRRILIHLDLDSEDACLAVRGREEMSCLDDC
jgi:hypothetical protein